jgi:hypothetical protein
MTKSMIGTKPFRFVHALSISLGKGSGPTKQLRPAPYQMKRIKRVIPMGGLDGSSSRGNVVCMFVTKSL